MRGTLLLLLACGICCTSAGCHLLLPEISHQPVIRNPFPQLSRVAVAPFFNQSDEPTVDGRDFAMAYYAELQQTPGFEVVPLGVVEEALIAHRIDLNRPGEARRLARLLGVDVVVAGTVTDYSPYYPPRCGLRVEWYTANPGYHEIPAGYGLPWNTPEEEFIPERLVYEAQMALARAQMAGQAPDCEGSCQTLPEPPHAAGKEPADAGTAGFEFGPSKDDSVLLAAGEEELLLSVTDPQADKVDAGTTGINGAEELSVVGQPIDSTGALPLNGAAHGCFDPQPLLPGRPPCIAYHGPVLAHTRIYQGHDPDVTQALKSYAYFRDDARFGGWESYLQRSEDFVRFCCHMHISEMLAARGGSHKTRMVWRWPESR